MLKNGIFNGPIIPCDALWCLTSCLTSNVFTQLRLVWVLCFSQTRRIIRFFPKIVISIILDGSLQPYS